MSQIFYAVKLLPPRSDFAATMTEEEKNIMQQHAAHWMEYMHKGMVHVFGPVLDPSGMYGLGIVSTDSEENLTKFINTDPASQIVKVEYYQMMAIIPEK